MDYDFDLSSPRPTAERREHHHEAHGHRREDPYHWMSRRDDETLAELIDAQVDAENDHHDAVLSPLSGLTTELAAELRSHLAEDDSTMPRVRNGWAYFSRIAEGQQYWSHYRIRPDLLEQRGTAPTPGEDAWEKVELLLDENDLAGDAEFCDVGGATFSEDGTAMAYLVDFDGDETYRLRFRDLVAATEVEPELAPVSGLVGFDADGSHLLVIRHDDKHRPNQLWRIDADGSGEELVLEVDDEQFSLDAHRSGHGRVAFVVAARSDTTRWWSLDLTDPDAAPVEVFAAVDGVGVSPDLWECPEGGFHLVWVTDEHSPWGSLHRAPFDPGTGELGDSEVLREPAVGVVLEGCDAHAQHLVMTLRRHLQPTVEICDADGVVLRCFGDPGTPGAWWHSGPDEYDPAEFHLGFSSPVAPAQVWALGVGELDVEPELLRRRSVPGFDPELYDTTMLWVRSDDGVRVPVSVTWRRGTPLDGTAACVLHGYGAYGYALEDTFSASELPLLDRGVVMATAHLRGGGEGGRPWWDAGRLAHKQRTFSDFHACAHALVEAGYAAAGRVCAVGRSAGGLVVGNVVNSADPVFGAVVADVPFVDLVTTMSDPDLPLTCGEWTEWGDPIDDEAAYHRMLGYSPYDNAGWREHRPHLRATAGMEDPRVAYHEPLKWVARLRETWPAEQVLILRVERSGHFGSTGRYDALEEAAEEQAFMLVALGVGG